jgi:hypothetical protein
MSAESSSDSESSDGTNENEIAPSFSSEAQAVATWTLPAPSASDVDVVEGGGDTAESDDDTTMGNITARPNLMILAAGAIVLAGLAIWLRRSM